MLVIIVWGGGGENGCVCSPNVSFTNDELS